MKIRSITLFCNPGWPFDEKILWVVSNFIPTARSAFEQAGYAVQTVRLATIPFHQIIPFGHRDQHIQLAQQFEKVIQSIGVDYLALGPAQPETPESYPVIPDILQATESIFLSGSCSTADGKISLAAVQCCAEVIHRTANISPDGFANLRFATLANVGPGSPFFPAAYHDGGPLQIALATEAADLAVSAFQEAHNLDEARKNLVQSIERHGQTLSRLAADLAMQFGCSFSGIDFSLAPFPTQESSLGTAMELLGVSAVGYHGSLAAAAILTEAIDRAEFPHVGFCGLMLPLLEDSVLADRASQGTLTVMDLLLYSAVCGTGLDTIPLPGDVSIPELEALLLDVVILAHRLNKPLTARLMPIPGKVAGDPTAFDFAYFANSRVLPLRSSPLGSLFRGKDAFHLEKH